MGTKMVLEGSGQGERQGGEELEREREGEGQRGRSRGQGVKGANACVPRRSPGLQSAAPILQMDTLSTHGLSVQKAGADLAKGTFRGVRLAHAMAGLSQFSRDCTRKAEHPPVLPICMFKMYLWLHLRLPGSLLTPPDSSVAHWPSPSTLAPPILIFMLKVEFGPERAEPCPVPHS